MEPDIHIQQCSAGVAEDVAAYWERKRARIEGLLRRIPGAPGRLRFAFQCRESGYVARIVLTLPTGTLVASTRKPVADHRAAVDQLAAQLTEELRRHADHVRGEHERGRRLRRERDFVGAKPHVDTMLAMQDREGFFEVMRPLLHALASHASRELVIAELEGDIRQGELRVGDLLDEVLVRAWDRRRKHPEDRPLDRWLVQLLHEILDERGFAAPDATGTMQAGTERAGALSVNERLREDDPRAEETDVPAPELNPDSPHAAEKSWAVENNPYWPFVDSLTRDDVVPAEEGEPLEVFTVEEERQLVLDELRRFPRDQRRALVLSALEGWTVEEIAAAQARAPREVRADIEAVRRALRQRLDEARQQT